MSLRARVLAAVLVLTCLTAAVTGLAVTVVVRDWVYQDAQETVLGEFRTSMENLQSRPDLSWAPRGYTVLVDGKPVQQGRVPPGDIPQRTLDELQRVPSLYRFERRPGGNLLMGHSMNRGRSEGSVVVFALEPLPDVSARLRHLTTLVLLAVAGSAVAAGGVGLLATRWLTGPLRRVSTVAARVADGDRGARLPETSVAELRDLSEAFNGMLDRQNEALDVLRRQDERSRRFVSDVSHELRSPLAALVPSAEVLREEAAGLAASDLSSAARLVADQVDALAQLVEDLLEMSRLDAGVAEVRSDEFDVVSTVRDALDARGWPSVRVDGPPELLLRTDRRRVVAVVTNLVGNAIRHGGPPVTVVVEPVPGGASVEVRDHGPGVPAGHEEAVFQRLHKAESSRSRGAGGGAGLGLAIARDNARLLGGGVDYQRRGSVTIFRAWFSG